MPLLLPEVTELLEEKNIDSLKHLLSELDPADIVELIEKLPEEDRMVIFDLLDTEVAVDVFEGLDVEEEILLLNSFDDSQATIILNQMAPDERADLFAQLSEEDKQHFLSLMEDEEAKDVEELLVYPPETAGGIMTTEFAWIPGALTAGEAIDFLRQNKFDFDFYQVYVLSESEHLLGIIPLKELITAPGATRVRKIMNTKLPTVALQTDQEKVAQLIAKYDLPSIPVVDSGKVMRGMITVDDVIDVIEDEDTEDMYKFGAAGPPPEDYLSARVAQVAKSRIVWLTVLLFASFLSGFVIQRFSYVLETVVTLVIFIPLLLGCGGNAGIQAASVVIRGLATGEIQLSYIWRVVRKELLIGILVGIGLGILTAIRALTIQRNPLLGLTVGLSMVAGVCIATVLGGLLPIIFKKLKLDPALMSSPLLTTLMDTISLIIYFGIAIKVMQIVR